MKTIITFIAFILLASPAVAQHPSEVFGNENTLTMSTCSSGSCNAGWRGRTRYVQRSGNYFQAQVGLININQMAARTNGNVGQSASVGGSGESTSNRKGLLGKLFGRRRCR